VPQRITATVGNLTRRFHGSSIVCSLALLRLVSGYAAASHPSSGARLMKRLLAVTLAIGFVSLGNLIARASDEVQPASGLPGSWQKLGTTHASHSADHDAIVVDGPHDAFRRIKFKVKDAPLHLRRLIVIFEDNSSQSIETRHEIPKDGESRVIDLQGNVRRIRRIDFWYDTAGWLQGTADVTVFGMK
jgi:hypothetical protein